MTDEEFQQFQTYSITSQVILKKPQRLQVEAYSSVGNLDLALEAIQRFIELSPGNTAMLNHQQYLLSSLPEDDGDEDTGFVAALEQGDYATAIKEELPRAEQGDASAQCNVASWYTMLGSEQDVGVAFEWCRKSAEQGYKEAQSQLGYFYSNGIGTSQDSAKALHWWHKAAEQGLQRLCLI